jgi:uncharacterized membrane protein
MAKKQNNQTKQTPKPIFSKTANWLENTFNRLIAIIVGIVTIFSIGFSVGDFKKDLENKVDVLKAQQECNNLVQTERDKCSEIRKALENQKLDELSTTIKELSRIKGGRNEK